MTPEEAVAAVVLDVAGSLVGDRVYVDKIPQAATYPLVRVALVHEPTDYHLKGGHRYRARVQVDAYAHEASGVDPYAQVMTIADAIHGDDAGSGLSGWRGNLGSPPFRVDSVQRIERTREYDPDELRLLRQRQDYWIFFTH